MDNQSCSKIEVNSDSELKYTTSTNDIISKNNCLQNIPLGEPKIGESKMKKKSTILEIYLNKVKNFYNERKKTFRCIFYSIILILYHVYLVFAVLNDAKKAKAILITTGIFWFIFLFFIVKNYILINARNIKLCHGQNLTFHLEKRHELWGKYGRNFKIQCIFYSIIFIGIAIFIERDTKNDRSRLQGLFGLVFFILSMFIFSKSRKNVCTFCLYFNTIYFLDKLVYCY